MRRGRRADNKRKGCSYKDRNREGAHHVCKVVSLVTLTVAVGWGVSTAPARCESQDIPHNAPDSHTGPITGHALHGWPFYRQHYGCWSGMNGYSCSGLKSECQFLFGSCRTF